jgi:hypothetical protein
MAVASKILVQINAKLGQPLWLTPEINDVPVSTMLIGISFYYKALKG